MDKQAFDTFLPLSTESSAHRVIVLDFFDLLATIAANSRSNGFGGLKLSRYMGWFAFSHTANKGFEAGYRSWTTYVLAVPKITMLSRSILIHL